MRYGKRGNYWVVTTTWFGGLIHLGASEWWRPLWVFPRVLYWHLRLATYSATRAKRN